MLRRCTVARGAYTGCPIHKRKEDLCMRLYAVCVKPSLLCRHSTNRQNAHRYGNAEKPSKRGSSVARAKHNSRVPRCNVLQNKQTSNCSEELPSSRVSACQKHRVYVEAGLYVHQLLDLHLMLKQSCNNMHCQHIGTATNNSVAAWAHSEYA